MGVKCLTVGQMQSKSYLVWDEENNAVIIDPGDDADFISQNVSREELAPRAILATHGHFDHVMAALELKLAYNIPFYMHKADEFLLQRTRETAKHFINFDPGPMPEVDLYLRGGSELVIGKLKFKIIHTPGHTPGSVSLYSENEKALFTGDLVFADGTRGEVNHGYSDAFKLSRSIKTIRSLGEGIMIYPGHGEPIASLPSD